eukprot:TRINITY_DN10925_c0_g1_i3.p1 TRINITY_DN10925_c0_g1~~TRINITY_DN10925_c0_g1_i3.p1  ORF type:complete len:141 (+),score=33.45 TRINITY_DN10925_c0_g1_i3:350-772(+)
MVLGSLGWQNSQALSACSPFTIPVKVSLGALHDSFNLTVDKPMVASADSSPRLVVRTSIMQWKGEAVAQIVVSDAKEDTCFNELDQRCHQHMHKPLACSLCAAEHSTSLAGCVGGGRWGSVVGYWCGCGSDCGGPDPTAD